MAGWSCFCGYPMREYQFPSPNGFLVFSDGQWQQLRDVGNLEELSTFLAKEEPLFDVYRCLNCGGLTVFGDNGHMAYYQQVDQKESPAQFVAEYVIEIDPQTRKPQPISLCHVTFGDSSRTYTYRCGDLQLHAGDRVLVPVGRDEREIEGQVRRVFTSMSSNLSIPYRSIKKVIGIIETK